MNARLRRRLLADAAVNSHSYPPQVERALLHGLTRYRRRAVVVYTVVLGAAALTFFVLVAGHPAAHVSLNGSGEAGLVIGALSTNVGDDTGAGGDTGVGDDTGAEQDEAPTAEAWAPLPSRARTPSRRRTHP